MKLNASFDTSPFDVRDKAIAMLFYRSGVKRHQVIKLQRRHYEPGTGRLTIPARHGKPAQDVVLDAETRTLMDEWLMIRSAAGVRPTAPLFCPLTTGHLGNPIPNTWFHPTLQGRALRVGIDRRVSTEGLRKSGIADRVAQGPIAAQLAGYVDEHQFRSRYPDAFETWESAVGLFGVDPVGYARQIGEQCRAAMSSFVDAALACHHVESAAPGAGTVTKLRFLLAQQGSPSEAVSAHHDALVRYWGTISDLDQRQAHEGAREGEALTAEDARRAILYTLLVMVEVDRAAD